MIQIRSHNVIDFSSVQNERKQKKKRHLFFRRLLILSPFLLGLFVLTSFLIKLDIRVITDNMSQQGRQKTLVIIRDKKISLIASVFLIKDLEKKLKVSYPLIKSLKFQFSFYTPSGKPELILTPIESLPWLHFKNNWLLTLDDRLIKYSENSELKYVHSASRTLAIASDTDYEFWKSQSRWLRELIISVNQQLPEEVLQELHLENKSDIVLNFSQFKVFLGHWGANLFEKRLPKLFNSYLPVRDNLFEIEKIDLRSEKRAVLTTH